MKPYTPGQPADPGSFAGRTKLIEAVHEILEEAMQLRRSSALLLQGYRGSGKTSAIRKIEALVKDSVPGALVTEIQLRARSSEEHLLLSIVKDIQQQLEDRQGLSARVKDWMGRVSAVSVAGTGVTLGTRSGPGEARGLTLWRSCVAALEKEPLLLVCIDDAELLDGTGLGVLKTIAESHPPVPVILVVAGVRDLWESLVKDSSPIARIFSGAIFDVSEFTLEETREALEVPVTKVKGTGRWTDDGVREVQKLSHGYPYLVQCFAAAAYTEGIAIGSQRVEETLHDALDIGRGWLERDCRGLSEEDVRAFARIAASGKIVLKSAEINALGVQNTYVNRLSRSKILKKVARGQYELRKAPAIAYYHALRRGISW